MKKYFNLIFVLIFITGCGYKNINLQTGDSLYINEVNLSGNKRIGHILENEILLNSSKNGYEKVNIDLFVNKEKTISNKDSSGKVTKYELKIRANLIITNLNSTKVVQKNFTQVGNFDVKSKHIDTINTEKKETRNLTNQISEEISNYFKISFIN